MPMCGCRETETRSCTGHEVYEPFWTKEREAGVWDVRGKAGNSQVEEKEQTDNQILAGPPETVGHGS